MECTHYQRGSCRSCTLLPIPYASQVAGKEQRCRELLATWPELRWEEPVTSAESGFRNKAKMVVAGSLDSPTLGILGPDLGGIDLRDCGLHAPGLSAVMPRLAQFVTDAAIEPYDVTTRQGELKHLLVTLADSGELMVRFVVRSLECESRVRKHLPRLREDLPQIRVVTLNLQPEHKAVLEGEREIVLTDSDTLPMHLGVGGGLTLHLRPQSFFQTNTAIATALYQRAATWIDAVGPIRSVLDLYCGVGGFALTLAGADREIVGVEVSAEAVASAQRSAREAGLTARFLAGDATAYALGVERAPDLVVVNPPRRGLSPELCAWLERSTTPYVLYSSCNPETLARDLAAMPSLRPVTATVLDMFPQTEHLEMLVLASR